MKKILALSCAVAFSVCVVGCDDKPKPTTAPTKAAAAAPAGEKAPEKAADKPK